MTDSVDRDRGRGQPRGEGHLDDELLSRLVDGDLAPHERRAANAHMTTCPACRESLDGLRSTVALLQALRQPRPARSFQLGPAYARRPTGWRRFSGWLTPSMPAMRAAVVALVLLVGGVAAFGALRDDPDFTGTSSNGVRTEPTVAASSGEGETVLAATVENPSLAQTEATTPPPTSTVDASTNRSAPAPEAGMLPTNTPETEAEEFAPISAAPDPASTVTVAVLTVTPVRDSIFAVEGETAQADADTANGADDADESDDGMAGETAAETATVQPVDDEPIAESDMAVEESADSPADEDDAPGAPQDGGEPAGDAPDGAADQDTSAAESAPRVEPTASATPSPTHQPTSTPMTPVASPVASPIASPVASPRSHSTGMPSPDGATSSDGSRRVDSTRYPSWPSASRSGSSPSPPDQAAGPPPNAGLSQLDCWEQGGHGGPPLRSLPCLISVRVDLVASRSVERREVVTQASERRIAPGPGVQHRATPGAALAAPRSPSRCRRHGGVDRGATAGNRSAGAGVSTPSPESSGPRETRSTG